MLELQPTHIVVDELDTRGTQSLNNTATSGADSKS